jgi:DNA-directed RNA polymerase subunit F
MEQAMTRTNKRSGWSDYENKLLWETADEAQQQGLPLKAVFERIAEKTGRRPNSIRNYYYSQVREREGDGVHAARFVPFTQEEVDELMEKVLRARAAGQSVRSCLQEISGGDHSLMLRYQNKYRSVIKSRPEYVRQLVDELNAQGVECITPQVNHRPRADMRSACDSLESAAHIQGDPELARSIQVLAKHLAGERVTERDEKLCACTRAVLDHVRAFVVMDARERARGMDEFCAVLIARIDELEAAVGRCE